MSKQICKEIYDKISFVKQCEKYDLPTWECPHFLIIVIGIITVCAMLLTYAIGNQYTDQPELVALCVLGITAILIIIGYFILHGFAKIAEANIMKTEFINIASHQLRTPLSIIKWTLNSLDDDSNKFTKEQLKLLRDIEGSNKQMINLVNDLLNAANIEQKSLKIKYKEIDLIKLTEKAIQELHLGTKTKDISIIKNFDKNPGLVWADLQKIKIVIQNLLDNAIRYSVNDKNTITISIKKISPKYIRWEIKDQGIGIPKQDQDRIFQKFFRSNNTLRYQTQGTGLGLFIAKAFIKQSKGKINFKSRENKGTTFWFKLPIKS